MLICIQKCEYFTPNLILQKSTAEAKIPAKTKRDKPTSIIESQLKVGVATGSLFVQSCPSHDITKISFGEEIEDLSKRSRDLKLSLPLE